MREPLKRLLEGVLVGSGAGHVSRWLHRDRALVLAFHNVIPQDGESVGDASLHLSQSRFCAFLDHLVEFHDVVPLNELLEGRSTGRPRVAITFDDAYRGAVTAGIDALAERGLPGTIFVAPAFVGDGDFWWDRFAEGSRAAGFENMRGRALNELRGEHSAICTWAEEAGIALSDMPAWARVASESELSEAASRPGITLGSHTWSHPNLARLTPEEVAAELVRSRDWLHSRFDAVIPWMSYPYGRTSRTVSKAVRDTGYEAALLITGGWTKTPVADPYAIPRCNVPRDLSQRGFMLRASGL